METIMLNRISQIWKDEYYKCHKLCLMWNLEYLYVYIYL